MDTLKRLISLEERRVSALVISMLLTLIFALTMYWRRGDITANLVNILGWLIGGITGVSIATTVDSIWGKEKKEDVNTGEQSRV